MDATTSTLNDDDYDNEDNDDHFDNDNDIRNTLQLSNDQ